VRTFSSSIGPCPRAGGPDRRLHSWRALERILSEGRCRTIGVSNFMVHHLEELLGSAKVPPAVNQIELHPWCQQCDAVAFCNARKIAVVPKAR